ncbi:hypothetical protein [Klebsiella oxytoca]|jgi:hypothetical protein|uniref:hypothetical protein n=1 Tax=Klebsiella oxytoca TaxID=571 RepID=UPI00190EB9A2|nr:hypothetical protein [Klebsiella oxytoca]HBM2902468.1 hypothetical protein [Klebsiella oxytoca]HBM3078221.1 hypothetical protein [Klebsiella oxytoca]HBM3148876.1 hypothetical protein [Klebsiella oxytoca]HCD6067204.1 hypothetical protein [Klebsiella oxytoca]HCD7235552.1 hypothetical protein [Klebsiella oxytoca]
MANKAERRQAQQYLQGGVEHVQRSLPENKKEKPVYSTHNCVTKQAFFISE